MTIRESFKAFWAIINYKNIAPWVIALLGVVYAAGAWSTMVDAQAQQVADLKTQTAEQVAEVKAEVQRNHDLLYTELVGRLDDIRVSQHRTEDRLNESVRDIGVVKDSVRDLRSDLSVVCTKVAGQCLHR